VDAGNHQTELLKSPRILPFRSIANQEAVPLEIEIRTLPSVQVPPATVGGASA
jgi:hypothetical protein